ncbi:MAG TPA: SprT family zinc-dependent metalloprotease [Candidatus Deferrimicrobium sp.]|nr:SprT family zinc-dependent metalloprotease [Candidatus Deferrimicrobium sp.]
MVKKQIIINSQIIDYELRKNKLSKYIRLTISAKKGLIVTIPHGTSIKSVEQTLIEKRAWILKNLAKANNPHKDHVTLFNLGTKLLFLGKEFPLEIARENVRSFSVEFDQQAFKLRIPSDLSQEEEQEGIARILLGWYTQQAKIFIPQRTEQLAKVLQMDYNRVTIKDLKSRWGSCSQLRNLNFNFRLVLAPLYIVDYVIVHELCHLKELNHSKLFWLEVERFCPEYKQHRQWLKTNAQSLFLV